MNYIRDNFHLKRLYALILAIIISFVFLCSIKPVYSLGSGTVIDPILNAVYDYSHSAIDKAATSMVDAISGSFQPSYELYYALTDHNDYQFEKLIENTGINFRGDAYVYKQNLIINNVVTFCQRTGVVLATLLAMFSLLMCILGRSEYIRDTPISIFIKYVISMALIYFSWNIMFYSMNVIGDLWKNFVMTSSAQTISYRDFTQHLTVELTDTNVSLLNIQIGVGTQMVLTSCDKILFFFLCIFLIWKLFKQFLRLYIEIAERYFVLTMMTFFSPTVVATLVTNSTSNIFSSYLRMFVCQAFILLINGIFMKIFVAVLLLGGWTCGIFNYICALAFMKFCMKIDSYMLSMGLNVAQTGSGFIDSVGGGFHSLANAARSLSIADKSYSNYGKALMSKGAATNDYEIYSKGYNMSNGMLGKIVGPNTTPSTTQFSRAVANTPTSQDTRMWGTYNTNGTLQELNDIASKINIPSSSLNYALNNVGISPSQVDSIRQLNGSKQFSTNAGTRFALCDSNGQNLAVIDGQNVYSNSNLSSDIDNWNKNNDIADYCSVTEFSEYDNRIQGVVRRTSTETTFGKQHYLVNRSNSEDAEAWEVTMVSQHPEVLDDKNAVLTYNSRGDAISLKMITPTTRNASETKKTRP